MSSLDEILDRFVEDHIDIRGMDGESRPFYLKDKAAAVAQIKAWVAEIIGPDETPAYSANTTLAQQTWFEGRKKQRQEQLKRLKDS